MEVNDLDNATFEERLEFNLKNWPLASGLLQLGCAAMSKLEVGDHTAEELLHMAKRINEACLRLGGFVDMLIEDRERNHAGSSAV